MAEESGRHSFRGCREDTLGCCTRFWRSPPRRAVERHTPEAQAKGFPDDLRLLQACVGGGAKIEWAPNSARPLSCGRLRRVYSQGFADSLLWNEVSLEPSPIARRRDIRRDRPTRDRSGTAGGVISRPARDDGRGRAPSGRRRPRPPSRSRPGGPSANPRKSSPRVDHRSRRGDPIEPLDHAAYYHLPRAGLPKLARAAQPTYARDPARGRFIRSDILGE